MPRTRAKSTVRFEAWSVPPQSKTGKTQAWSVVSRGQIVGVIRWMQSHRRYAFTPAEGDRAFDAVRLAEIAAFLEAETTAHKANVRRV